MVYMDADKNNCIRCQGCCKFLEEDIYFAPLFTRDEIKKIKGKNQQNHFKKYKDVFQVKLVPSKKEKGMFVCPFLNEDEHLCKIYSLRPLDCKLWPVIFMKDKDKIVLACFKKHMCTLTNKMKDNEFEDFVSKKLDWIKKEKALETLKKHPGLVWDFEANTFIIKKIA